MSSQYLIVISIAIFLSPLLVFGAEEKQSKGRPAIFKLFSSFPGNKARSDTNSESLSSDGKRKMKVSDRDEPVTSQSFHNAAVMLSETLGAIDLYVEHRIDDAKVVQNLALPEPEHVDDIQEDVEVEDDPGVGTHEDNNPGVVSQVGNEQVQSSGLGFSDEEANLETIMKMEILIWKEVLKMKLSVVMQKIIMRKVEGLGQKLTIKNVGLGEKDDVQSAYYDCENPFNYQSEKEEVEASFEHITNAATSRFKYPSYNPNLESVDLEVGILYDDEKQFKKTMINYAVYSTRNIHFVRNELSICVEYNAEIFA
nr:uncharacterized protein LOC109164765 [Ipomoea batatas]